MQNAFVSIVGVINGRQEVQVLSTYLINVFDVLEKNFRDVEIILVNNSMYEVEINAILRELDEKLRKNIFLLNLSSIVNKNHAILAGLDRSNGDYTAIFEFDFANDAHLIFNLYEKAQEQFDIVYLRAKSREAGSQGLWYHLFYYILNHYSDLQVDKHAHNTRIISRRALNSLLRLRENLRYMKAIYSIVGYKNASIDVEQPLMKDPDESFAERFRTSLIAITSFTDFLRTVLLWIFIFSILFLFGIIGNALLVKFFQHDIFGKTQQAISGWTFLVVISSVFFAITCLNLYIMSIYLSNIYNEIKQRPLYIIESIKRF
jgi:dolichol-phosphate mannosyltransferase